MILKIYNGEYSLQWDGIYHLALIDYPNIQEWELEKIAKFIAYEKLHKRQTSIECTDSCLKKEILDYICQHPFLPPFTPTDKRVASTYDLHKRLVTSDYCSHTTTIDAAISIFKTGQLLSAVKAFGRDAEELVLDSRNAASDPKDYFDYVMLGWSNTSSGYRLAMERLLGRAPSEKELQDKFIPGVSFHFIYTDLIKVPGYIFDGYHVAKVKDMLNLLSELYICIIPTHNKSRFENIIPMIADARSFDEKFLDADIVLADLPCSGIGIIGKKPDIKYRLEEDNFNSLAALQKEILDNVVGYVKKDGELIFSTCTLNRKENEENMLYFLEKHRDFKAVDLSLRLDKRVVEKLNESELKKGYLKLIPGRDDCDGFFIAVFRRNND